MLHYEWGNLPNSTLTARRIASGPQVVVGTPTYFARAREPTMPSEPSAHEAVIYDQGAARRLELSAR